MLSSFRVRYQNVRGLRTKTDYIYSSSGIIDADIVMFTETWLNDSINNQELFDSSFVVHRCDRNFALVGRSSGGGVLSAFANNVVSVRVDVSSITSLCPLIDLTLCKCRFQHHTVFFANIYIPPNIDCDDYELFLDALSLLLVDKLCVIVGDFNAPAFVSASLDDRRSNTILHFMETLNLRQVNNIVNSNGRLLDLVLTNVSWEVIVVRDIVPFVPEDAHHPAIDITINVRAVVESPSFPSNNNMRYNFSAVDMSVLCSTLAEIDWRFLSRYDDVDQAVNEFYSKLYGVFDTCVPRIKSSSRHYPVWFDRRIRQLVRMKEFYFKKWKRTKSSFYLNEFKRLRHQLKLESERAYKSYQHRIESDIVINPKTFWKFVNDRRASSRIPGHMDLNGIELNEPGDIVNAFALHFSRAYRTSTTSPPLLFGWFPSFGVGLITEADVLSSIAKLKKDMTSGDDCIPGVMVRECAAVLTRPLLALYTLIVNRSFFPSAWKVAKVIPIFKQGDRKSITNYRPVSVLPHFAKILEHILYTRIYISIKPFLSQHQHGFIPGRSTNTNLVNVTQFISRALDDRRQVDVIYTDFAKAFDSLDINILLAKLDCFGFCPSLLKLMESYLRGRSAYVTYNGFNSNTFSVTSGVPQGSHLGPLLFNIFINDLLEKLRCNCLSYADDLKIYSVVNNITDCINLQTNLSLVDGWCACNNISLNVSKCCVISFTRCSSKIIYEYSVKDEMVPRKNEVRDLGVLFDSRMTFSDHIRNTCLTASRSLGFVIRSCRNFTNIHAIKCLYFALVQSRLEYASLVWYPYYTYQVLAIEKVQKRFLKYLSFRVSGSYPERGTDYNALLLQHGFHSLLDRRDRYSAKFLLDVLANVVDSPSLLAYIDFCVPVQSTRSSEVLRAPRARTNILIKSPVFHMVNNFNKQYSVSDNI